MIEAEQKRSEDEKKRKGKYEELLKEKDEIQAPLEAQAGISQEHPNLYPLQV